MKTKLIVTGAQEPLNSEGFKQGVPVEFAGVEGVCTVAEVDHARCEFDLGDGTTMAIGHVPVSWKHGTLVYSGDRVVIWMTARYTLSREYKGQASFWCEEFDNLTQRRSSRVGTWATLYAYVPTVWERLGVEEPHVHDPASQQAHRDHDLRR